VQVLGVAGFAKGGVGFTSKLVFKPILGVPHFGSVGHLPTKNADRVSNPVSVNYLLTKSWFVSSRTTNS